MTTLTCQKHLFSLEEDKHYINCAYMSPLLQSVEQAGIAGMLRKRNPYHIRPRDFFEDGATARALFAQLVNAPADRVALLPSASYGLGIVARNLPVRAGGRMVTVQEEFPSDVYTLHRMRQQHGYELVTVQPPDAPEARGKIWNERLLEAIDKHTVIVNLSSVHWADGTIFDLEAIGRRAKEVGALFVVDGSQSVGAMPIDVQRYNIDALVCVGYKWLMGPYTSAYAYFSDYFDGGQPLEESWMNREGSDNFKDLVHYEPAYYPKAARYNMGEYSNFINIPMQIAALRQLLEWTPDAIGAYAAELSKPLFAFLAQHGYWYEEDAFRARHIFGFRVPPHLHMGELQQRLLEKRVMVSLRGSAVRVSPHVYNDEADIAALMDALQ